MVKLTDFSWQTFLGKLLPESVSLLGHAWKIPEWQAIEKSDSEKTKQKIKQWIEALKSKNEEELIRIIDHANQINIVGTPDGREELQIACPSNWFTKYKDIGCQDLAVRAFVEQDEEFRLALDWLEVLHKDRWECYQAESDGKINICKANINALESSIRQYWREKGFGGKCMITSLQRDSVSVIDVGYEQEPQPIREFDKSSGFKSTVLKVTHPVRDALLFFDETTRCLKVRMYRGNTQKFDELVRRTAEICFEDADLFATGANRKARYNLDKFKTRPAFIQNIDNSTGLNSMRVVGLVLVPSYLKDGIIEAKIPAKQAQTENKDAYDVLGRQDSAIDWKVIKVSIAAYFEKGRRKILPIELKAKGGSTLSGDPRYEIIEEHLRNWGVLK